MRLCIPSSRFEALYSQLSVPDGWKKTHANRKTLCKVNTVLTSLTLIATRPPRRRLKRTDTTGKWAVYPRLTNAMTVLPSQSR